MSGNVVIRGCYSVRNKKGRKVVSVGDTAFALAKDDKNPDILVMSGNDELPDNIIQIGSQIAIELEDCAYDKDHSIWAEKTDRPYTGEMEKDRWENMIRVSSHVFDNIPVEAEGECEITVSDPPTSTVDESRTLEFAIYLRGEETKENFLMLAEQHIIAADKNRKNYQVKFTVHYCGFVIMSPEGKEKIEALEEALNACAYGIGGSGEVEMKTLVKCADDIPKGNTRKIMVDYKTAELYEFNSWDENK